MLHAVIWNLAWWILSFYNHLQILSFLWLLFLLLALQIFPYLFSSLKQTESYLSLQFSSVLLTLKAPKIFNRVLVSFSVYTNIFVLLKWWTCLKKFKMLLGLALSACMVNRNLKRKRDFYSSMWWGYKVLTSSLQSSNYREWAHIISFMIRKL